MMTKPTPTPFDLSLPHELDSEAQSFANNWLFKWHNLNIEDGVVDVEDFYGGNFGVGGIVFEGQIRELYWRSVEKYLAGKIHSTFEKWDFVTSKYPCELRQLSLDRTRLCLLQFASRVVDRARDTDRRLRGRGFPDKVTQRNVSGLQSGLVAEIDRLTAAYASLLQTPVIADKSLIAQAEEFFTSWRGTIAVLGIFLALIFGILKILF